MVKLFIIMELIIASPTLHTALAVLVVDASCDEDKKFIVIGHESPIVSESAHHTTEF